eukprot:scaffold26063_cov73-Cylindrotheca_fusiformis.AAC.1
MAVRDPAQDTQMAVRDPAQDTQMADCSSIFVHRKCPTIRPVDSCSWRHGSWSLFCLPSSV